MNEEIKEMLNSLTIESLIVLNEKGFEFVIEGGVIVDVNHI